MLLNEDKFELILFGKEDTLKLLYSLLSGEYFIESNNTRGLGLITENNINCAAHISGKIDMTH